MFALRYVALCFGVLAAVSLNVNGLSDDEKSSIKSAILPFVQACGKEFGVTEDEIKAAKAAGTIKDMDPCLIACVFKKIGIVNDEGMFDEEKATELTKKFVTEEDEQQKGIDIIHTCAAVNDETVGDENKGCERAKLLIECYLPLKGQFPGTP